jgi:hypothetical protein
MYAPQPSKTVRGDTGALQIRQFNAPCIAHHHVFNISFSIDQHSDLSIRFK